MTALPDAGAGETQHALSGPSRPLDAAHWPVRGDLAHVALAGRCFVPHYAQPMAHVARAPGSVLRAAPHDAAAERDALPAGAAFDVLDIAGGWAWGLIAPVSGRLGGAVGYVPLAALTPATAGDDTAEAA